MTSFTNASIFNRRNSCTSCASNLVLTLSDAAIILVVSVLVCLRVIMLGT